MHPVAETVGAGLAAVVGVGDGAGGDPHRAVARLLHEVDGQGLALRVDVVGQHVDGHRTALVDGGRIVSGYGRLVHVGDGNGPTA